MKIAFVTPWFYKKNNDKYENFVFDLAEQLAKTKDFEVEVLTTCAKDENNKHNFFPEGKDIINGIKIRRFHLKNTDNYLFEEVKKQLDAGVIVDYGKEKLYILNSFNSIALTNYIKENKKSYDAFVFLDYNLGTTYFGIKNVMNRAILIPHLKKEMTMYIDIYRKRYKDVAGMIFLSNLENQLSHFIYGLSETNCIDLEEGVDTEIYGVGERFREKYGINDDYFIYRHKGEEIQEVLNYFSNYKKTEKNGIKMLLLNEKIEEVPLNIKYDVIQIDVEEEQDFYDAIDGAKFVLDSSKINDSQKEIKEVLLLGKNVVVNKNNQSKFEFAKETNAILWYSNFKEFYGVLKYVLEQDVAKKIAKCGQEYVGKNFSWDKIIKKYTDFMKDCIKTRSK